MLCVCVQYLKLLSELRGVALSVDLQHLLIGYGELVHRDGGLSTQTGLQNGIMDEHILLLRGRERGGGKHSQMYKVAQKPSTAFMGLPLIAHL